MTSHLLDLRALHIAAPGVLEVVFGPDGPCDFWSAPVWGSVARDDERGRTPADYYWVGDVVGGHVRTYDPRVHVDGEAGSLIINAALDCRVPSVAARLLGLCAQVMDPAATGAAWLERRPESWALRYRVNRVLPYDTIYWTRATGAHDASAAEARPVDIGEMPTDEASFIAALVTALAPRITTLGGVR